MSNHLNGDCVKLSVMKKTGVVLAVLGLFLMIAVGCGSSADDATSGDTDAVSFDISKVEVGMTEQEVIDAVGESNGTSENGMTGENGLIYMDDQNKMVMIWFKDGKVTRVGPN